MLPLLGQSPRQQSCLEGCLLLSDCIRILRQQGDVLSLSCIGQLLLSLEISGPQNVVVKWALDFGHQFFIAGTDLICMI